MNDDKHPMRKKELFWSFLVWLIVFSLNLFWFVLSDRRLTFLYGHLHHVPDDTFTLSRHFITSLVASGIVFVLYWAGGLLTRKIKSVKQLPAWRQVWRGASVALTITLTPMLLGFGKPPMTPIMIIWIIVLLVVSLYLALSLANYLIRGTKRALALLAQAGAFVPALLLIPAGIAYGVRRQAPIYWVMIPIITIVGGLVWLFVTGWLGRKLKLPLVKASRVFQGLLVVSYLLVPLIHYLTSRQEHLYITNADNLWAPVWWWQLIAVAIVLGAVCLVSWGREQLDGQKLKVVVLASLVMMGLGYMITELEANKSDNVWLCVDDQWVPQGEPNYDQPFPEECGIIDKIMM